MIKPSVGDLIHERRSDHDAMFYGSQTLGISIIIDENVAGIFKDYVQTFRIIFPRNGDMSIFIDTIGFTRYDEILYEVYGWKSDP